MVVEKSKNASDKCTYLSMVLMMYIKFSGVCLRNPLENNNQLIILLFAGIFIQGGEKSKFHILF